MAVLRRLRSLVPFPLLPPLDMLLHLLLGARPALCVLLCHLYGAASICCRAECPSRAYIPLLSLLCKVGEATLSTAKGYHAADACLTGVHSGCRKPVRT